jgi:SAM-dependent methyltransferase
MSDTTYLLSDAPTELERLQLQSRVWEPAARELLALMSCGERHVALDVGCGVMGWLRALDEWVGSDGRVVGTDIDASMLERAASFAASEGLERVELVRDDLFATSLPAGAFDLVHARFQIAPLGRGEEQVAAYARLARPGGWIVLEDPDIGSWHVNPDAPATAQLIELIAQGFRSAGGDFDAGRRLPDLLRPYVDDVRLRACVVALPPGHPYLRLPLQFTASLRPRLDPLVGADVLTSLVRAAESELARPDAWGTTFTLVQAWGKVV